MFTFGIFSTHLPYIAFVLFYGFFFLAGIEKASAGDIESGERIISEVISLSVDNFSDVDEMSFHNCNSYSGDTDFEQLLLYGNKLKLNYFSYTFKKTTENFIFRFSRPPPVA